MISQTIAETAEQLNAYQRYEQDKNVKQKVEATRNKLGELRQHVATFASHFRQVSDILERDKRQYVYETGKGLLVQLTEAEHNFEQQPNQALSLNVIVQNLKYLQVEIEGAWRIYAQDQIRPRRELYNLVTSFPEIVQHSAQITTLFQHLDLAMESFPASLEDRRSFYSRLERLDSYLEKIHVPESVRRFLEQVREGQFTVADLDEEILAWCREGDRGRVFKITF